MAGPKSGDDEPDHFGERRLQFHNFARQGGIESAVRYRRKGFSQVADAICTPGSTQLSPRP
jgi:hypothetical protein